MKGRSKRARVGWWTWRIGLSVVLGVLFTWGIAWYVSLFPFKGWGCGFPLGGRWVVSGCARQARVHQMGGERQLSGQLRGLHYWHRQEANSYWAMLGSTPHLAYEAHEQQDMTFGWPLQSMCFHTAEIHQRQEGQELHSSYKYWHLFEVDRRTAKRLGYRGALPVAATSGFQRASSVRIRAGQSLIRGGIRIAALRTAIPTPLPPPEAGAVPGVWILPTRQCERRLP